MLFLFVFCWIRRRESLTSGGSQGKSPVFEERSLATRSIFVGTACRVKYLCLDLIDKEPVMMAISALPNWG